jgi:hypothetical protein
MILQYINNKIEAVFESPFISNQKYKKKKVKLDSFLQVWTVYDGGPKTIKNPLICLPPGIYL